MSDRDTARLLEDTATRILERLCTPALLRAADLGGAGAAARDAAGVVDVAHRAGGVAPERLAGVLRAVGPLANELSAAGLDLAMAPEREGGSELGWRDVRGMLDAAGRFGAPVPLAEACAARALARQAGAVLPGGQVVAGVARPLEQGRVVAVDAIAHPSQARWVACTLVTPAGARLLVLPIERGEGERTVSISGEERASLRWRPGDAAVDVAAPEGCDSLVAGAAVRCAQIAGACARVVAMSAGYANDRVQFGRPIGKFQAIQQQLALAGEWAAMAAMASRLALGGDGVGLDRARVAAAKQVAGTAVETCASIAHAVHGAIGVTAEYDLPLLTRRLWTWAGEFGSSQYWAGELGGLLLDGRDERVWDEVIRLSTP